MSTTVGNNIALVLSGWLNQLKIVHPGLKTIYSETTDYVSSLNLLRAQNIIQDDTTSDTEVFAFSRINSLEPDLVGRKGSINEGRLADGRMFPSIRAKLDIGFVYYTNLMPKLDEFEIKYWCSNGLTSVKYFDIDLTSLGLGIFKYQVQWNTIAKKEFSFVDRFYKSVGGTLSIHGDFFLVTGDEGSIINEITMKIYDGYFQGDATLLSTTTILGGD